MSFIEINRKKNEKYKILIKQIINIQKYVRRFLIQKHFLIPASFYQTKNWRKNRKWYKTVNQMNVKNIKLFCLKKLLGLI